MRESPFKPSTNQQQFIEWLKQQRDLNVVASPERLFLSPGRALKIAWNARLTQARMIDLQHAADAQRRWHRQLPDRLQRDTPHHATLESTY